MIDWANKPSQAEIDEQIALRDAVDGKGTLVAMTVTGDVTSVSLGILGAIRDTIPDFQG